jgi:DNA polymerase III delta prime subunit
MFVNQLKPTCLNEVIGNKRVIQKMVQWLKLFWKSKEKKKKVFFIWGKPGIGKTTAAHLVCNVCKIQKFEYNASDIRSQSNMEQTIQTSNKILGSNKKVKKKYCIIMDEIDGIGGRGAIPFLMKLIKNSQNPLIFICNENPMYGKFKNHKYPLKTLCYVEQFQPPSFHEVYQRIKLIKHRKNMPSYETCRQLYENGNRDVRFLLNQLQFMILNDSTIMGEKTTQSKNIFELTTSFFDKKIPIKEKLDVYFQEDFLLPLFVQENYPNRFHSHKLNNMWKASDFISESAIIEKTLKKHQEYSLMPYIGMLNNVSLFTTKSPWKTNFPSYLKYYGAIKRNTKVCKTFVDLPTMRSVIQKFDIYFQQHNTLLNSKDKKTKRKYVRILNSTSPVRGSSPDRGARRTGSDVGLVGLLRHRKKIIELCCRYFQCIEDVKSAYKICFSSLYKDGIYKIKSGYNKSYESLFVNIFKMEKNQIKRIKRKRKMYYDSDDDKQRKKKKRKLSEIKKVAPSKKKRKLSEIKKVAPSKKKRKLSEIKKVAPSKKKRKLSEIKKVAPSKKKKMKIIKKKKKKKKIKKKVKKQKNNLFNYFKKRE